MSKRARSYCYRLLTLQTRSSLTAMPVELVFLHVRPVDLRDPSIAASLVQLVVAKSAWSSAIQVMLHRFVGVAWTGEDLLTLATFIQTLYQSLSDERVQRKLKEVMFGQKGLLKVFIEGDGESTPYAGESAALVGGGR